MATYNRPELLRKTLESIYNQYVPFEFETIVVDDCSPSDATRRVCKQFPVIYHCTLNRPSSLGPAVPRNRAYKMAQAPIIINQSDEVIHVSHNTIEYLTTDLKPCEMLFANVHCLDRKGRVAGEYTGPRRQAPLFFLGSLWRKDLYAVGGNDEEFILPCAEDRWMGNCLTQGLGLVPRYSTSVVGHHQWHPVTSSKKRDKPGVDLVRSNTRKAKAGIIPWCASGGPWPYNGDLTEELFTSIYEHKQFYDPNSRGTDESVSGAGSSQDATTIVRKALPLIIKRLKAKSILDAPCGDFNWMQHVNLNGCSYTGMDIVLPIIDNNLDTFANSNRRFLCCDFTQINLPQHDLIICRDGLVHMSFDMAQQAIANFKRSSSKFLLATTFPNHTNSKTIELGGWAPYNLQAPPFNLPQPIHMINEDCREYYPQFKDKSLGLWNLETI